MLKASQSPLAGNGNFETENMNYEKHCKSDHELKNYSIINREQQTSTKVVQTDEPNQQKREILPISSVRSLFCIRKGRGFIPVKFVCNFLLNTQKDCKNNSISVPYRCLSYQATQFDQGIRKSTIAHSWTATSIISIVQSLKKKFLRKHV